jgi:hypothetical protein
MATAVLYGSDDDALAADKVGGVEWEAGEVYPAISTTAHSSEQGMPDDRAANVFDLNSKSDAQPRTPCIVVAEPGEDG